MEWLRIYAFALNIRVYRLEDAEMQCKNKNAYCENRSHNALAALHRGAAARSSGRNAEGVAVVTRPQISSYFTGFSALVRQMLTRLSPGLKVLDLSAPWEA